MWRVIYFLTPKSAGAFTPMEPVDTVFSFSSDGAVDAGGRPGGGCATSASVAAAVMAEYIDMMSWRDSVNCEG